MNFSGTVVVGLRAQVRSGKQSILLVPRVVLVELTQGPQAPSVFSAYAVPELSTWSTCPPRHLGPLYLASCNVPTANFTAWNTAQST